MTSTPPHLPEYRYKHLPEAGLHIRLLKLEPGKKDDRIHCHLFPVRLEDAARTYECISYVWGDSTKSRRIILDGHYFYITSSLYEALLHFRDETVEKTLWADAICIQQTHPPEKGRQVQLMGKIYESASRTLVWLGPDGVGIAKESTEFLKSTAQVARDLTEQYGSVAAIPALSKEENPVSQDVEKWKLFENFLKNVWFSRGWCLQEVGIAADVKMHWGDADVPFSDLINVNEFQRHAPHLLPIYPMSWLLHDAFVGLFMWYGNPETWRSQVIPDILVQGKRLVPEPNLIDSLIQSSRRNVTDLRDYIFAILGHPMAMIGDSTIVEADYERHVDEIFLEVSAKLLAHVDPALPLSVAADMGARSPRDLDSDQPSWVVRWELALETASLGRPGQWYYAGGTSGTYDIAIDTSAKTLTIPAVIFDKVAWYSDPILKPDIDLDKLIADPSHIPAIDWVWEKLPESLCRYPDSQSRRDAFTLSLVSGRYKGVRKAEDDMSHHRHISTAYSEYLAKVRGGGSSSDELRAEARDFEDEYTWTAHDRRFMVTQKGFYGLGPQLLREGDEVAVFQNIMVPYVLRATGEGNRYKLVGACYVHGVMRGEVLDAKDPLGLDVGEAKDVVIV